MVARDQSAGSRSEVVMDETLKGAARGGILGSVGGLLTGAVVGALGGALNPLGLAITIVGAVAATVGAGVLAATAVGPFLATAGLIAAFAPAVIGAATGAMAGLGIGTGIGVGWFGSKGALAGSRKADDQQNLYNQHKQAAMMAQANSVSNVRAQAAEQYTQVGYQAGFEEGANYVVSQIIAAKQAQMAAGNAPLTHGERVGGPKVKTTQVAALQDSQQPDAGWEVSAR